MKMMVACMAVLLGGTGLISNTLAAEKDSSQTPSATMKLESSFSESASREGIVQTIVNTTFVPTSLYNPQKKDSVSALLTQRFENRNFSGREGTRSKLEVIAWVSGKNKYDTKLWAINDCAEVGTLLSDFYQTTEYGCCGAENLNRAYNLKTGKFAFSYTTEPISVAISFLGSPHQNGLRRHISYVSINAQNSACQKNILPKNSIGALTLSDGDVPIDRIILKSVGNDGELAWSPKLTALSKEDPNGARHTLVMYKDYINPADAVKGFSVKAFYYQGMEVIVPIVNDRFDINSATLPASIKIRRIAIEPNS